MVILFISNTEGSMFNFRGPIIKRHIDDGDTVYCMCSLEGVDSSRLLGLGVKEVIDFRFKPNLKALRKFGVTFSEFIRKRDVENIHVYTISCILYFVFIRIDNFKVFCEATFTGMGRLFGSNSTRLSRRLVTALLNRSLSNFSVIFFQNDDDMEMMRLMLPRYNDRYRVVYGSGIEVNYEQPVDLELNYWRSLLDISPQTKICLMASRLESEKGYNEFYQAAEIYERIDSDTLFIHIGPSLDQIKRLSSKRGSNLRILPFSDKYASLLFIADIFVLPSTYREGIPRSLIEAVRFGIPIVTMDSIGCRQAVIHGGNGILIRDKSPMTIVNAIVYVMRMNKDAVHYYSRHLLMTYFDVHLHYEENKRFYKRTYT